VTVKSGVGRGLTELILHGDYMTSTCIT